MAAPPSAGTHAPRPVIPRPVIPLGVQMASYATGFFSLSLTSMTMLVVPLWALEIGASPFWIGFCVAARSFLSLPYSIHGGVLIGRIGNRRGMLVLTLAALVMTPLYPLFPSIAALAALQAAIGVCQVLAWVGAQAEINRIARSHPVFTSRFSFYTVAGTMGGPVVAGLAWQIFGPWGAFGTMALWTAGMLVACWYLPSPAATEQAPHPPLRLKDLLPRPASYIAAFRLALRPAPSFVVFGTFMRNCLFGMRMGFYAVYLDSIRMASAEIGLLAAASSIAATPATLLMTPALKRMAPHWVMLVSLWVMALGMVLLPLVTGFTGLFALALVSGIGMGLNLSFIIWGLSKSVKPEEQALAFGVRATANPLGNMSIALLMGAVAEAVGLRPAFLLVGGAMMLLTGAGWLLTRRKGFALAGS